MALLALTACAALYAQGAAPPQTTATESEVFIPANGFNLGATVTTPSTPGSLRSPAIVLAAGPGLQDRDYAVSGVAVFRQLAQTLGRAGFLVVRYDGRNVGASGGRADSAGISEYADDAIAVMNWVRRRRDVDTNRLAILGYAETGAIALTAARHDDHVKALVLLAAAGATGRELILDQQHHVLARSSLSEADRTARIDLQQQIMDAAISGVVPSGLPQEAKDAARSAWFKSWLLFDPARILPDIDQPVLLVTGALDTEMPPAQAQQLDGLARARHNSAAARTRTVIVPGVNHLLVGAATGERDEYASLGGRALSPGVGAAITAWLKDALAAR